jgi:uncharacterized membrane protein
MNDLIRALGMGAVSGARSMLGPAMTATSAPAKAIGSMAAAGEMAADKSTGIGARTDSLPLSGRIVSGAYAAAAVARPGRRLQAAAVGAAGALAATFALYHARRFATERLRVSNAVAGLVEDVLAVSLGLYLTRARRS